MLYHYTDFAAFDGIIRCAELRLNNILNMNDTSEMKRSFTIPPTRHVSPNTGTTPHSGNGTHILARVYVSPFMRS